MSLKIEDVIRPPSSHILSLALKMGRPPSRLGRGRPVTVAVMHPSNTNTDTNTSTNTGTNTDTNTDTNTGTNTATGTNTNKDGPPPSRLGRVRPVTVAVMHPPIKRRRVKNLELIKMPVVSLPAAPRLPTPKTKLENRVSTLLKVDLDSYMF